MINAGSSSLKFSFYEGEKRLLTGQIDGIGVRPKASATGPNGETITPPELGGKPAAAPSELLPALIPGLGSDLATGVLPPSVTASSMAVTPFAPGPRHAELLAELETLVPLAPLHEPHNLAPIKMALS